MERKAKGSIVKLMVKPVRFNKTGAYDNVLSDKAKEFVNQRILDSIWYPFEMYKELYNAVCKISAKNNPKIMVQWGHEFGKSLFVSTYKLQVGHGDIKNTIEKYERLHRLVFNFGEHEKEIISDNQVVIRFKDFDRDFENFYYLALGWAQKFMELSLNKKIEAKFLKKSWEGANETEILLSWSS